MDKRKEFEELVKSIGIVGIIEGLIEVCDKSAEKDPPEVGIQMQTVAIELRNIKLYLRISTKGM